MASPTWRSGSLFGDGPRKPLNRDQRGIMKQRFRTARLKHNITALQECIGVELLQLLSQNGALYPTQDTIAQRVSCCLRTVSNALRRFRNLGLMDWVRRLIRICRDVQQTSNAYWFRIESLPSADIRCGRKSCRRVRIIKNSFGRIDRVPLRGVGAMTSAG